MKENKMNSEKRGMTRRDFLKKGIKALAVGTALSIPTWKIGTLIGEKLQNNLGEEGINGLVKELFKKPTEEQLKIEEDDQKIIGETIEEQLKTKKQITLDKKTKLAIYDKWYKSYSPGAENYYGLEKALQKMAPWIEEMKKVFKEVGVPEHIVFLAIPESHFDLKAVSGKFAGGPFQFIEETGKAYNLKIENAIDERFDPIKSARACAEYLKKNYEELNNDWKLALAEYNGAYAGKYKKHRENKKERNYQDYLAWREERINSFINQDFFEHTVSKNETLENICKKYKLSTGELLKFNNLKSSVLKVGQKIKLPPTIDVKLIKLSDSLENLNYPEKFFAVLNVIKSHNLEKKFAGKSISFKLIKTPKIETNIFSYKLNKGETVFVAARSICSRLKKLNPPVNLSINQVATIIQKQNGIKNGAVSAGQELKVALPIARKMTLGEIAVKYKIALDQIQALNPAIISSDKALPENYEIRLPKS